MENERRTKKLEWRSLSGGGETKKIKVPVIDALGRAFIFFLVTFIHWASIRVNWPPSVLQPPQEFPSSVSWTSSGRSSLWRSRSWLPEQQIAGSVAPLCFSPSGDFLLRFPVKKHIFLSLTCSGLAKVAASHFRTFFLYKSSNWGNLIFNSSLKRLKNYIFRHRLIFQLSEIIINAAPAETLKIIFFILFYPYLNQWHLK